MRYRRNHHESNQHLRPNTPALKQARGLPLCRSGWECRGATCWHRWRWLLLRLSVRTCGSHARLVQRTPLPYPADGAEERMLEPTDYRIRHTTFRSIGYRSASCQTECATHAQKLHRNAHVHRREFFLSSAVDRGLAGWRRRSSHPARAPAGRCLSGACSPALTLRRQHGPVVAFFACRGREP